MRKLLFGFVFILAISTMSLAQRGGSSHSSGGGFSHSSGGPHSQTYSNHNVSPRGPSNYGYSHGYNRPRGGGYYHGHRGYRSGYGYIGIYPYGYYGYYDFGYYDPYYGPTTIYVTPPVQSQQIILDNCRETTIEMNGKTITGQMCQNPDGTQKFITEK